MGWRELLAAVTVEGAPASVCDERALRRFEEVTRRRLPADYREYAKVFGSGLFADSFRIYCPHPTRPDGDLLTFAEMTRPNLTDALLAAREDAERERDRDSVAEVKRCLDLARFGFAFGDTTNADLFLWDWRQVRRDGYAIYGLFGAFEGLPGVRMRYLAGSFRDFVVNVLLEAAGEQRRRVPELAGEQDLWQKGRKSFTRF